jgi:hypothetical protein
MPYASRLPAVLLPASFCATLLLAGCGAIPAPTAPVTVQGVAVRGNVHGGQQPVSNSHVHLLAANIGGYGTTSAQIVGPGTSPTYHSYSSGIPGALAIDGSGDVWAVTANSSVVEMIGAAVPVVTPISAGSSTVAGKLGLRP